MTKRTLLKDQDSKRTLLIDGDWVCYKAATIVETEIEWDEDQWTLTSDAGAAMDIVGAWVADWILACVGLDTDAEVIFTFSSSDSHYFRHDIFPDYKGKRKGKRKPTCYKALRAKIIYEYDYASKRNLEADDLMGIFATSGTFKNPVIVTIDKDLDTVPGLHYNPDKDKLYDVSVEEAEWNHMFQTLVGDVTDGFKGCPGVGKVKAEKWLDGGLHGEDRWAIVRERFLIADVPKSEANVQAQLAHILQDGDYDFATGEVRLKEWM